MFPGKGGCPSLQYLLSDTYEWSEPDSLSGEGPFKIRLSSDLFLDVVVTDSENAKVPSNII